MRRQRFYWTYLVLATVLTIYGGYSLIYNATHQKDLSILGLVFFIVGLVLLIIYLILYLTALHQKRKNALNVEKKKEEVKVEEDPALVKEEKIEEPKVEEKKEISSTYKKPSNTYRNDVTYERRPTSYRSFDGGTGYIKQFGYGPVLRIDEEEIYDMRTGTYYRIEGNMVKQKGYGPVYEISGNRIRAAFGGYLYEISGSNVNKVFGGFYASFSGAGLQTYDSKERYEITCSLNLKQKLAVVALLFGTY